MATTELAHHVESSGEDSQLSSPPHSTPEPGSPSAQIAHDSAFHQNQSSITVNPPNNDVPDALGQSEEPEKPARKKPGRKPGWSKMLKENPSAVTAESSATDAPKKRIRKPRDPNAPPIQRRKRKVPSLEVSSLQPLAGPAPAPGPAPQRAEIQPRPSSEFKPPPEHLPEKGNNEGIQNPSKPMHSFFSPGPPPPPPPPPQPQQPVRTSGQNYDPIRSNYDPVRETVVSHNHANQFSNPQGSPNPPSMNRASASPSISSLVDPPNHALTSPSIAAQSFFNQQQHQQQQARYREEGHNSLPPSPHANRLAPAVVIESSGTPKPPTPAATAPKKPDILAPVPGPSTISKKTMGATSTATSSAAASPKPPKPKDVNHLFPTPPPLPGSGLMQLGGGGPADGTEFRAPTVILSIPMNGEVNKYINFTRLAEEQYGWDALHPRLAAQRDRLARVAAAGAALERNGSSRDSGDEMSLDSEGEGEGSNVEMGGMSDGRTGTDGGVKKVPRKRKMKEDEYDKDDGFVDDSELLWEEQAAAANDGFFVYSGPLVPEGEKPATELRADGAPKRGRGRGSRGGRLGATGTRGGASGPRPGREGLPASGPGSRGGLTTRKPRITKADRARMEQEKLDREKMGTMAMQPNGYGGMAQLASAANLGSTPMVSNQG